MSAITIFRNTAIAGSLPKPAWLSETNKLWPAEGRDVELVQLLRTRRCGSRRRRLLCVWTRVGDMSSRASTCPASKA
jgi:hypothetical protein